MLKAYRFSKTHTLKKEGLGEPFLGELKCVPMVAGAPWYQILQRAYGCSCCAKLQTASLDEGRVHDPSFISQQPASVTSCLFVGALALRVLPVPRGGLFLAVLRGDLGPAGAPRGYSVSGGAPGGHNEPLVLAWRF